MSVHSIPVSSGVERWRHTKVWPQSKWCILAATVRIVHIHLPEKEMYFKIATSILHVYVECQVSMRWLCSSRVAVCFLFLFARWDSVLRQEIVGKSDCCYQFQFVHYPRTRARNPWRRARDNAFPFSLRKYFKPRVLKPHWKNIHNRVVLVFYLK